MFSMLSLYMHTIKVCNKKVYKSLDVSNLHKGPNETGQAYFLLTANAQSVLNITQT